MPLCRYKTKHIAKLQKKRPSESLDTSVQQYDEIYTSFNQCHHSFAISDGLMSCLLVERSLKSCTKKCKMATFPEDENEEVAYHDLILMIRRACDLNLSWYLCWLQNGNT